jgi:hypothetical protein
MAPINNMQRMNTQQLLSGTQIANNLGNLGQLSNFNNVPSNFVGGSKSKFSNLAKL